MVLYELVVGTSTFTGKRSSFDIPPDFTGHPTKSSWKWYPIVYDNATHSTAQKLGPATKLIENGNIVYRRTAIAKTTSDLKGERLSKLIQVGGDLTVLNIRLIDYLLASTEISMGPADFSLKVRQSYQNAKAIADKLDPPST